MSNCATKRFLQKGIHLMVLFVSFTCLYAFVSVGSIFIFIRLILEVRTLTLIWWYQGWEMMEFLAIVVWKTMFLNCWSICSVVDWEVNLPNGWSLWGRSFYNSAIHLFSVLFMYMILYLFYFGGLMLFLTFWFKQQVPALLRNKVSYSVTENGVSHSALEPCWVSSAHFIPGRMQRGRNGLFLSCVQKC